MLLSPSEIRRDTARRHTSGGLRERGVHCRALIPSSPCRLLAVDRFVRRGKFSNNDARRRDLPKAEPRLTKIRQPRPQPVLMLHEKKKNLPAKRRLRNLP